MTLRRTLLVAVLAATVGASASPAAGAACRAGGTVGLTVRTVPPLHGVRFALDGKTFVSGTDGLARTTARCGTHALSVQPTLPPRHGTRARFDRWGDDAFQPARTLELTRDAQLEIGFAVDYLVREDFVDLQGRRVDWHRVSRIEHSNSLGGRDRLKPGVAHWLVGSRVMRRADGLQPTEILYSVRRVFIDGTSVVRQAQQRFYPARTQHVTLKLLLYSARINAIDTMFKFPIGSGITLAYPDGHVVKYEFGPGAQVRIPSLPRGRYYVEVDAPGRISPVPISLTKDQVVPLKVLSYYDIAFVIGTFLAVGLALAVLRRPHLRRWLVPWRWRAAIASLAALAALVAFADNGRAASTQTATPVLAYYYIWYQPSSWRRAKIDYPLLGRYSSDDVRILGSHVASAERAGLDGFLVSWKSTPTLDRRLAKLVRVANTKRFRLGIVYQGLDFERQPLPAARVARDLRLFADRYARNPAFRLFGKPVVIWSGTWRFSRADVARVTRPVRDRLLVLASERSPRAYRRLTGLVDGDAYYWSSVNPDTYPGYPQKLAALSAAVHADGGLWIAPAAPGFDARLLGGSTVVDRRDGETLRRELDAAAGSSPDGIGLISWNEFSENSHVEPSVRFGRQYVNVLRDVLRTAVGARSDFASDDAVVGTRTGYGLPLLVGLIGLVGAGAGAIAWRKQVTRVARV